MVMFGCFSIAVTKKPKPKQPIIWGSWFLSLGLYDCHDKGAWQQAGRHGTGAGAESL